MFPPLFRWRSGNWRFPIPTRRPKPRRDAATLCGGLDRRSSATQADHLLKAAEENRGDAVAMLVLLQKAYEQAVAASAIDLTFKAIDQLSANFSIEGLRMKLAVLKIPDSTPIATAADLNPVVAVFQQAISEDNFPVAADAAAISLAQAKTLNVANEIGAANRRVQVAAAANAEYGAIKPLLARLTENPNDAEANLAAAKFYCFTAQTGRAGAASRALHGPCVVVAGKPRIGRAGRGGTNGFGQRVVGRGDCTK